MPRFLAIGYGDRAGYEETPSAIREQAHRHDARLVEEGAVTAVLGDAVQVRNPQAEGTTTTDGSFMTAALPVAGFSLIEAASIEDAVRKVASTPCAVANGVVELWPLVEEPSA